MLWSIVWCILLNYVLLTSSQKPSLAAIQMMKETSAKLLNDGSVVDLIAYLENINNTYHTLYFNDDPPTLYTYLGVAYYSVQKRDEAQHALKIGLHHSPNESRAWMNLGEIQVQTFQLDAAVASFHNAFHLHIIDGLSRMIYTMGWSCDWKDFEVYTADIELYASHCMNLEDMTQCLLENAGSIPYAQNIDFIVMGNLEMKHSRAQIAANPLPDHEIAGYWQERWQMTASSAATTKGGIDPLQFVSKKQLKQRKNRNRPHTDRHMTVTTTADSQKRPLVKQPQQRLKLGFISSDFGVHPVSSLIRGLLQYLDRSQIEVYCFSLQPSKTSWWGSNITYTVEHYLTLANLNYRDAARIIAQQGIEILIDLNGHTFYTGFPYLAYQPARIHLSFLGLPTTTGAEYIDYYLGDRIALPPADHHQHFSER